MSAGEFKISAKKQLKEHRNKEKLKGDVDEVNAGHSVDFETEMTHFWSEYLPITFIKAALS